MAIIGSLNDNFDYDKPVDPIRITVWDYTDAMHGHHHSAPKNFKPVKYEVKAHCVGGKEGIIAYFLVDNMLCEARGDDGHWWMVGRCHVRWLEKIKIVINSI